MNSHGFILPNTDANSTVFDFLVIFCSSRVLRLQFSTRGLAPMFCLQFSTGGLAPMVISLH